MPQTELRGCCIPSRSAPFPMGSLTTPLDSFEAVIKGGWQYTSMNIINRRYARTTITQHNAAYIIHPSSQLCNLVEHVELLSIFGGCAWCTCKCNVYLLCSSVGSTVDLPLMGPSKMQTTSVKRTARKAPFDFSMCLVHF